MKALWRSLTDPLVMSAGSSTALARQPYGVGRGMDGAHRRQDPSDSVAEIEPAGSVAK